MAGIVRYTWFVLVFTIGVILVGSLVRATGSGAGCGRSWPTCQGELVPPLGGATAIEFTHRMVSGVALILVIVLAIWVWRTVERGHPARLGALLGLTAIVGEALIGAMIVLAEWVAEDASVARAISVPLHLVNTLFLLAALTLTAFWLNGGGRLDLKSWPLMTRAVFVGGLALVFIAASGAVTALADTLFPGDGVGADFTSGAHFLARLRIIHPILAVVAAGLGWWFSGKGELPRIRTARALPILVGLMLITGAVNVLLGVPIWMQLLHLALADVLWISYILISAQTLQFETLAVSA
jgi:heme A synthase